MANEFKVRKGLSVNGSGSVILDVQGSQGQLFSVTDVLSGSLFAVKDISGMPVIEAFSDDRVNIGTFNREAIKVSGSVASVTGSFTGSFTGSLFGTASQALTASYAMGGSASSILFQTASAATTWSFNHFLQTQYPVFTIYDEGNNVIVPQQITAVDTSSALIYFSSPKRGVAVASKGGYSASVVTSATTANTAITASYALLALSASNAPGFTFTFSQSLSAVTWSINHNMNTRTPLVQVYDINYNQLIPNQVVSVTQNLTEVRFDYGQNGYAVLSSGMAPFVTGSTSLLNQTTPAVTWSFAHNLNTKYVNFEVYDANDYVMLPSAIRVIDTNNAEIHLAYSTTGRAVANFSGINGQMNAQTASLALTASFVRPLSQSVAITGSGTTNSTLDITGIQANSAVNPPKGTISLYYDGVDGATAGVYGASVIFSQRYNAVTAAPIAISMIAGVKVTSGGNFGGGLTFWTSNETGNSLAERVRIDASGSMGVGHKSPTALLHISGSGSGSLMRISSTVSSSIFFVSGSGNVGINTVTPSVPLSFGSDVGNKIALYDAGSTTTIYGFGIQSSLLQIFANTSTNRVGIGYGNSNSFTETLTVKGLNVGINKTSPSASLDVSGSMLVTGSLAMSGSFTQVGYKILTTVSQSLNYADDTAAAAGGVPLGGLYRNGNFILIRLS